mgnify:CR=1 FL=1
MTCPPRGPKAPDGRSYAQRLQALRKTYEERKRHWAGADIDPEVKAQLAVAIREADAFWKTVDEIASAIEPLFHRGDSGDSVVLTGSSALAGSGVLTRHDVS